MGSIKCKILVLITFYLIATFTLKGQNDLGEVGEDKILYVKRSKGNIILDGKLDEKDWKEADIAYDFYQNFPYDTSLAISQSEIRITFNDKFIYVGAKMHDNVIGPYIIRSLRRDFQGPGTDALHLIFDTFSDQTNAFSFSVNPYGVQREGLVANGGSFRGTDVSWDNKWFSEVKIEENYWVAELAIPLKTIRYKKNSTHWKANFLRIDNKQNERSVWSRVPRGFGLSNLAFTGRIIFQDSLPKIGANISLIPFLTGGLGKDYEEGTITEITKGVGADMKIGITPSLNLDITINPDFSQVEVDVQQTNLSRFELFFPERRQFFLENADLFASLGLGGQQSPFFRPFFSRRIGIDKDTSDENIQIPILGGLRLSGKLDNNWRMGILNMQTAATNDENRLPSINYGMIAVQRKLFTNSNATAFFINKQPFFNSANKEYNYKLDSSNRVFGVEYNLRSANGRWNGKACYHQSITPGLDNKQFATGGFIFYRVPKINFFVASYTIRKNFNAEVGFVPRTDVHRLAAGSNYSFYPNTRRVNRHGPGIFLEYKWSDKIETTDWIVDVGYDINFQNSSSAGFGARYEYVYLFEPFDPSGTDGLELDSGTSFLNKSFGGFYRSDVRKPFSVNFRGGLAEYFGGTRLNLRGTINYRVQPHMVFGLSYNYDRIRLPKPYNSANLWLVGPRIDITFTRKLFLTAFLQYNSQDENINLNTRFQWRFKPVSDLFLVYTDNYLASSENSLGITNRAIIIKLVYWFTI